MKNILSLIELIFYAVALFYGVKWYNDPSGPYEPITFLSMFFGGTGIEIFRRLFGDKKSYKPRSNILEKLPVGSPKSKVLELLGEPHKVCVGVFFYKFSEAFIQVDFYPDEGIKTIAIGLTNKSSCFGFIVPDYELRMGELRFRDLHCDPSSIRFRQTLRSTELVCEIRVGPPGAWTYYTFGALSPLVPGDFRSADLGVETEVEVISIALGVEINWVALSASTDEVWFDWMQGITL